MTNHRETMIRWFYDYPKHNDFFLSKNIDKIFKLNELPFNTNILHRLSEENIRESIHDDEYAVFFRYFNITFTTSSDSCGHAIIYHVNNFMFIITNYGAVIFGENPNSHTDFTTNDFAENSCFKRFFKCTKTFVDEMLPIGNSKKKMYKYTKCIMDGVPNGFVIISDKNRKMTDKQIDNFILLLKYASNVTENDKNYYDFMIHCNDVYDVVSQID